MPAADCHFHVFDPARFPYQNGIIYTPHASQAGTADQLLAVFDAHGISHGLAVGGAPYGDDNRCLLDGIARSKGRLKGIALVKHDISDKEITKLSDGGIVGEAAADFITQFKVDHAVIGASALDVDGAMLDFDYREVRVAQAIVNNARNVMLVADAMKFERSAPVRISHLSHVDIFVTDRPPPEAVVEICRHNGVQVEIASAGEAEPVMAAAQ